MSDLQNLLRETAQHFDGLHVRNKHITTYYGDLANKLNAAADSLHWAQSNPGLADQYREEALSCRVELGFAEDSVVSPRELQDAISRLIKAPESLGEPVAWLCTTGCGTLTDAVVTESGKGIYEQCGRTIKPLYLAPQPVVPEGWVPVGERLPPDDELVMVFTPGEDGGIDFDGIEEGVWFTHDDNYQHFILVGGYSLGGEDCSVSGPSVEAPYTHWMPLPEPPAGGSRHE
jgi:hypothetical protein